MLSIFPESDKFDRRAFLRIGSLGLGGVALSDLLSHQARATDHADPMTGKSVIFVFLHGGPSQIETFDPKMTAPAGIHSVTGEVSTNLPGVTFGGTFPQLARLADKVSVVRSFQTGDGNHDIKPIVSRHSIDANLGSVYARMAGTTHRLTGMPTNIALFPQAVDATTQPANNGFGKFSSPGSLGSAYAPFVLGSGQLQHDMKLNVSADRLADRRYLLSELDRGKRLIESAARDEPLRRFR